MSKRSLLFVIALLLPCMHISMTEVQYEEESKELFIDCTKIDSLLAMPSVQRSDVGLLIYDLVGDSTLYEHNAKEHFRPASVQKILTSVALLDTMSSNASITTTLWTDGGVIDSVLRGNLYLRGGFDSEFSESDMDTLVKRLRYNVGVRRVDGKVYADVSMKDEEPYQPGWNMNDSYYYYQPELSPLIYHKGYLSLTFTPSTSQRKSTIEVSPPTSLYEIENKTSGRGELQIRRNLRSGSRTIQVSGHVSREMTDYVTVPRPYELFAAVFCDKARSIGLETGNLEGTAQVPNNAIVLCGVERPLIEVVQRALKNSDNLSAEALFYILGDFYATRPLETNDCIRGVKSLLNKIDTKDESRVSDGCGLSKYNRVSAKTVAEVLRYAYKKQHLFASLYPSMSVSGVDGTLRSRMKNTVAEANIHGKTGSLTGVNCLAGYATAHGGNLIAFAILMKTNNASSARNFQDQICTIICSASSPAIP